jgi:hypothetical protein
VAYQLSLPENSSAMHDVFHVSAKEVSVCARVIVASGRSGSQRSLDLHREANTYS